MKQHPTAVIEPGAEVAECVEVGPFAYIQAGARIGRGSRIGPHVTVMGGVELGEDCRVHAGAVLGDLPQDLAFKGEPSSVRIGHRCVLREGVTVHRGTKPGTATVVGDDCFLMANSHLAHNVQLGPQTIVANGALLAGYVEVGARAFISGNVAVHQFVKIGRLAMLGGGAGVSKDVPPFCTLRPCALNTVAGLNVVGMRRAGMSPEQRMDVRRAFKLLFRSGLNPMQASEAIRSQLPDGPAHDMARFVDTATRGLCAMGGGEEESA